MIRIPLKWIFYLTAIFFMSAKGEKLIELNHYYDEHTPVYPGFGMNKFGLHTISNGTSKLNGLWFAAFNYEGTEHSGTHMDAPSHFSKQGWTVDQIPIDRFFAPAVVIDIRSKGKVENLTLTAQDVTRWVKLHGSFPNNSVVLVLTGWESKYNDSETYFGISGDSKTYPGIDPSGFEALLSYKNQSGIHIVGVGIDGPSLDIGTSKKYEVHRGLFAENIYGLENLKNLHKLPATGAQLVAMPMKIKGGSGAPCRVIAQIQIRNGSDLRKNSILLSLISLLILLRTT